MRGRIVMGSITDLKSMLAGSASNIRKSAKKTTSKSSQKSGVISVKRSFNASQTLAQLANAKTKPQVDAIERTIRAQMQSMKKQDGGEEAVRQMKKVLQKANMKHQALTKEEQLDNNRKVAKIAKNKREEVKLLEELEKKRRNRMGREQADVLGSVEMLDKNNSTDTDTEYSYKEQNTQSPTSVDIACDSFEVSTGVSGAEFGIAIDTLL